MRSVLSWRTHAVYALTLALVWTLASTGLVSAAVSTVQLSSDPYTNTTSQHQTEVEPDTYSFGNTIVSAFQAGRFTGWGSSNIGWATNNNAGASGSWTNGFLPGTTVYATPAGSYDRASDPVVAYDAAHGVWLIESLVSIGSTGAAVLVSQSTDATATAWNTPTTVHARSGSENLDKNWIVCDDTSSSPFYGHCYAEWDDTGASDLIHMSTSTDGGLTWGAQQQTANNATGIGGQPLVQPNGTVIVPIDNAGESAVLAFTSTNGGASWSSTVTIASISSHIVAGGLRNGSMPSAEIDGAGTVYVVWRDCRFESRCKANDIVMSTSSNGTTWSAVARIPADPVGSGVDHFTPGLGVDKSTSGSSAHLVLAYYYYPVANCTSTTCRLDVGYSSSTDGGAHWTSTTNIAGPMTLSWLANTSQGRMVADYISTSFNATAPDTAFPVFASASAPLGGTNCGATGVTCQEAMFTTASGLALVHGHNTSTSDRVVFTTPNPSVLRPATSH